MTIRGWLNGYDLVVTDSRDAGFILFGDGTGNFLTPDIRSARVLADENQVIVGLGIVTSDDFNGDSIPDFAAVVMQRNPAIPGFDFTQKIAILLVGPRGDLSPYADIPLEGPLVGFTTGDFTNDGILDVAVLFDRPDENLVIYQGSPNASFSPLPRLSFPVRSPRFQEESDVLRAGDVNGDGNVDLSVRLWGPRQIITLLGDGSGSFPESRTLDGPFPSAPVRHTIGDFNGDGLSDMAVMGREIFLGAENFTIFIGNGEGDFTEVGTFGLAFFPDSIHSGDFNGDDIVDLAVEEFLTGKMTLFHGDGTGGFSRRATFKFPGGGDQFDEFTSADFNGDHISDLVMTKTFGDAGRTTFWFGMPSQNIGFESPAGDFSSLIENPDGTFTRTLADGTRVHFNARGLQTSVVDRNGHTTTYAYDESGRLTLITDPLGLLTTFEYGQDGFLDRITDPAGRVTAFDHDEAGRLTRITDPDGSIREFTYDGRHRLTGETSKTGELTTYDYNFAGRNIRAHLPDGSTREVNPAQTMSLIDRSSGLGTKDRPAPITRPEEVNANFQDGNGNETQFQTDRFGAVTSALPPRRSEMRILRDEDSSPIQITNSNGAVTTMTYDDFGNLLSSKDDVTGVTTSFTYVGIRKLTLVPWWQVETITDPNGNTTTFHYDRDGNVIEIIDAKDTRTRIFYSDLNCRGLVTRIVSASGKPEASTTSFTYDQASCNLTSTTDPNGSVTAFTYDPAGNVASVTDAENRTTQYAYDALNRLTQVTDPIGSVTSYEYDQSSNLTRLTDARGSTTPFEYDSQDRLIKTIDPLGNTETFTYDRNGNLTSTTDRKGETITFEYDSLNQLTKKTLPGNELTTYEYDPAGNLTKVIDPDSTLTFTYDYQSRLISSSTSGSPNQPDVTITYTYDPNGNRLTMTDSLSGTTTYTFDELNRLSTLADPLGNMTSFTYDSLSRRTSLHHANGIVTQYTFDPASQLKSLTHKKGEDILSSFTYGYDRLGNRTSLSTIRSIQGIEENLTYQYDSLNRLTQATRPLAAQSNETFSYDEAGNRLQRDGDSQDSVFDPAHRLIEDTTFTYTYDRNGNLTQKKNKSTNTTTTYSYDAENQLIKIDFPDGTFSQYRYDGLGRRIEKNVKDQVTRYVYDGEDILFEFDRANTLLTRYTHGPGIDEPLIAVSYQPSVVSYFYLTDGLGSITELTDSNGELVQSYLYDSFGNVKIFDAAGAEIDPSSGIMNPYTYTGQTLDPESGLYHYEARYYNPTIGRFLQQDPILVITSNSQSIHPYAIVRNNPTNFIDPDGQWAVPALIAIGIIAIGTILGALFGALEGYLAGGVECIAEGAILGGIRGLGGSLAGVAAALFTVNPAVIGLAVGAGSEGAVQVYSNLRYGTPMNPLAIVEQGVFGLLVGVLGAGAIPMRGALPRLFAPRRLQDLRRINTVKLFGRTGLGAIFDFILRNPDIFNRRR